MNYHVLTLFPEMIENGMNTSITGRAITKGLLSLEAINIRDFAFNKHQKVDDYPYGGGAENCMYTDVGIQYICHTPPKSGFSYIWCFRTPQTERLSARESVTEMQGNVKGFFYGTLVRLWEWQ